MVHSIGGFRAVTVKLADFPGEVLEPRAEPSIASVLNHIMSNFILNTYTNSSSYPSSKKILHTPEIVIESYN